ncbi:MAG: amino acid ABC transporter substrate-binding protein [Eggerthellaceae bacterium]|nr:amino acid ABC transporter substrate-binding protein [Eggerthellaceae bacterium]
MGIRTRAIVALGAALACLALVLGGCSSSNYQPELKEPVVAAPTIGQDGTLRVGVDTTNPPLAGMGTDKIIGIDVDIAAAMADQLGLKLSIVDVGSDPETALAEGKVDIVMGIDQSEAGGDFWLSEAYLPTGVAAFASSPDAAVPVAGTDVKFAAQISSKSAWAVTNEFGEAALTSTTNLTDAFEDLATGTDGYVAADAIIGYYAAHGQDIDVSIVAMLLAPSGYCVGVAKDNTELQALVTETVGSLTNGRVIDYIERKWLGTALDLSSVPQTAGTPLSTPSSDDDDDDDDGSTVTVGGNAVGASGSRN